MPTGAVTRLRLGHERRDGLRGVGLEAEVAVREDADEDALVVRDRDARDPVALHQLERLGHGVRRRERDGLDDHPRLRALHLVHLGDLILDREVPVDDPDPPARASAIASRASVTVSIAAEISGMFSEIDGVSRVTVETSFGRTLRLRRDEEHVVEGEPLLAELPLERDEALDLGLVELGLHQRR